MPGSINDKSKQMLVNHGVTIAPWDINVGSKDEPLNIEVELTLKGYVKLGNLLFIDSGIAYISGIGSCIIAANLNRIRT